MGIARGRFVIDTHVHAQRHAAKISNKEAYDAVSILSAQPVKSFLTQEKIDFLKLCLGKIPINKFHKKYFWIDSNYKEAPELTQKEIKKRVRDNP